MEPRLPWVTVALGAGMLLGVTIYEAPGYKQDKKQYQLACVWSSGVVNLVGKRIERTADREYTVTLEDGSAITVLVPVIAACSASEYTSQPAPKRAPPKPADMSV